MKNILIASYDMEVGGVERSLISMLENFDYNIHKIDLMLYRQQGDFLNYIPSQVNLLGEVIEYTTYRKSISEIFTEKQVLIGLSRILAKVNSDLIGKVRRIEETGYIQMQLMWKYALPFLPDFKKGYDVAISYLWPHYFVADKVKAKKKIAWIHTDYSMIETDIKLDLAMWDKFDHIMAVSEACKESFLMKYPELSKKIDVMENIVSSDFIKKMANEKIEHSMFKDKRFKIVTVARLSHAKGIDNAVRALELLVKKGYTDIAWYVVGYGGDERLINELINELKLEGNFFLIGKQLNPYPFMNNANLYVQPSRYEGKSVTVSEAQVLNKPVVITNYPTARSQVDDGINGIIVESTVQGLAEGIESLYVDKIKRDSLSTNSRKINGEENKEIETLYKVIFS